MIDDVPATRADLTLAVSELISALERTKRHLVGSQLLISSALFLALKFIH